MLVGRVVGLDVGTDQGRLTFEVSVGSDLPVDFFVGSEVGIVKGSLTFEVLVDLLVAKVVGSGIGTVEG